ncbi:MAG: hypothetical protein LAO76_10205 [Acidobacteriia bacterium]|nr:hypothetical protein [Terriglobia bacterium]
MKMARIVIILYVLLTAAITVGSDKKPVSSAVIKVADCCSTCPPICPWPPSLVQ